MASLNYILVRPDASRLSSQMRIFIDALAQVKDQGNRLKATLAQANLDGAANLATSTGMSSDDAATVYALIASAMTDINANAFIAQLLSRCG